MLYTLCFSVSSPIELVQEHCRLLHQLIKISFKRQIFIILYFDVLKKMYQMIKYFHNITFCISIKACEKLKLDKQ